MSAEKIQEHIVEAGSVPSQASSETTERDERPQSEVFQERLRFLAIDDDTRDVLKRCAPAVGEALPDILTGFYDEISRWPEINNIFGGQPGKDFAKGAQVKHWMTILEANFDQEYVDSVTRIGNRHNTIGLEPRWYIGGYTYILAGLVSQLVKSHLSGVFVNKKKVQAFEEDVVAVLKAAMLDMDMAISTYFDSGKRERQELVKGMAEDFDENVSTFIQDMVNSSEALSIISTDIGGLSTQGLQKSEELGGASNEATENVSSVAGAAEEMMASIKEITTQVTKASSISQGAVQESQEASLTINDLKDSSSKIGEVIGLIQDIAEQTNLLALNATIEAARAGEAGKGFAVVASEVKELASQTGKATGDISEQITAIQGATENTVKVIENVANTIDEINQIANSISAAMEEQSTVIQDVVSNTQLASQKTATVNNIVGDMRESANNTQQASENIGDAASDLVQCTDNLRGAVEVFLANIKSSK